MAKKKYAKKKNSVLIYPMTVLQRMGSPPRMAVLPGVDLKVVETLRMGISFTV